MSDPGRDQRTLVTGGRVVDPRAGTVAAEDLVLDDGRIAARGPAGTVPADAPALDARGLLVCPGLVDMHVHLREPGQEYKETIETGRARRLAGGFTAVACMANTNPVNDSAAVTSCIVRAGARGRAVPRPPDRRALGRSRGRALAEIGEMQRRRHRRGLRRRPAGHGRGAHAARARVRAAVRSAGRSRTTRTSTCAEGGAMNEGAVAPRLGLRGQPGGGRGGHGGARHRAGRVTGGALHVAHVRTARAVDAGARRQAPRRAGDVPRSRRIISLLTEEAVRRLRHRTRRWRRRCARRADVDALREALADGTIDAIATDHAPHSPGREGRRVRPGGVRHRRASRPRSALGLKLVADGVLDLPALVARLTVRAGARVRAARRDARRRRAPAT